VVGKLARPGIPSISSRQAAKVLGALLEKLRSGVSARPPRRRRAAGAAASAVVWTMTEKGGGA